MPYSFSLFYVWLDFVFHQTVWWIKQKKRKWVSSCRIPTPWFPFFCHFITCLGLRVLFCSEILQSLSANTWTPRSLVLTVLLAVYRCFALVTLKRVLVRTNQFGKFFPSSLSPFPLFLAPTALFQQWTRDVEQGTKGAFSEPLCGPLPLLSDLSPNLEYMFIHGHACAKCQL